LNNTPYETGEEVTDAEMQMLRIRPHKTLPEWNYTITPQSRQRRMWSYFCAGPKGNDVAGNPQPPPAKPLATPPTTGQDKSTGNDLVGGNKGQAQDIPQMRPDFDTLDTRKKGYLTARDVKSHQWLSKHFTKCDLNHDGHLTQDEYANCHE
jgi:hypothetical protein